MVWLREQIVPVAVVVTGILLRRTCRFFSSGIAVHLMRPLTQEAVSAWVAGCIARLISLLVRLSVLAP